MQQTIELTLPVRLRETDIAELGKQISDRAIEIEEIEKERKRIAVLRAEILELSHQLNSGTIEKPVKCTVMYDNPRHGIKTVVRTDTAEVIEQVPMTDEEMQLEMPLAEPGKILQFSDDEKDDDVRDQNESE